MNKRDNWKLMRKYRIGELRGRYRLELSDISIIDKTAKDRLIERALFDERLEPDIGVWPKTPETWVPEEPEETLDEILGL